MPQSLLLETLSKTLKPLCPRDRHVMRYEVHGIRWKDDVDSRVRSVPSYHCDFGGCSVRYNHTDGYFTVVDTPDHPFFVEEPGTNILQCPRHGAWLYRCRDEDVGALTWRCGVERCDYVRAEMEVT
jgi:hypothetical protein